MEAKEFSLFSWIETTFTCMFKLKTDFHWLRHTFDRLRRKLARPSSARPAPPRKKRQSEEQDESVDKWVEL